MPDNARMQPPLLTGQRTTLRALAPADAASIQRNADDTHVWETLFEGFPSPYTMADAKAWCEGGWRLRGTHSGEVVWAVTRDNEAIGCISVRQDAGWLRCNAEVGYWIGRVVYARYRTPNSPATQ